MDVSIAVQFGRLRGLGLVFAANAVSYMAAMRSMTGADMPSARQAFGSDASVENSLSNSTVPSIPLPAESAEGLFVCQQLTLRQQQCFQSLIVEPPLLLG